MNNIFTATSGGGMDGLMVAGVLLGLGLTAWWVTRG